ncbi:MAG: cation:proton antiporter [Chlamydiota bacterium]
MTEAVLVSNMVTIVILLIIVSISAIILKRLKFSYTIGLVVIGMIISIFSHWGPIEPIFNIYNIVLSSDIILYILLPSLVFQAALTIDSRLLIKNLTPIMALALPGLCISTVIIGWIVSAFTPLSLEFGLLFGALISATDPVAVIQIFREIRTPRRLTMLVDGESLFNDASAIVVFSLVLSFISFAPHPSIMFSITYWTGRFLYVFLGGTTVGIIMAMLSILLINKAKREPLIQITTTTVLAYITFITAEYYLHVSGIMAVLSAGITINWYSTHYLTHKIREYTHNFWEFLSFVANSMIFLLLGITEINFLVNNSHTSKLLYYAVIAIISITFARAVIIYLFMPIVKGVLKFPHISNRYKHIIFWGGLRGAIPLALSFSLDPALEHQQLIVELTLLFVLFTLLVQGTTLRRLIHILKFDKKEITDEVKKVEAKLFTKEVAKRRLYEMYRAKYFKPELIAQIQKDYDKKLESLEQKLRYYYEHPDFTEDKIKMLLWNNAIASEKHIYTQLFEQGIISIPVIEELILNMEIAQDSLHHGKYPKLFVLHVPLEITVKAFIGKTLNYFMSDSAFVHRLIQQAYIAKYEISTALVISCQYVAPIVREWGALYKIPSNITEECVEFYQKRREHARDFLNSMAEEDVPTSCREGKIILAAINAEYDELENLDKDRRISPKIHEELKSELEETLDKYKEKIKASAYEISS